MDVQRSDLLDLRNHLEVIEAKVGPFLEPYKSGRDIREQNQKCLELLGRLLA